MSFELDETQIQENYHDQETEYQKTSIFFYREDILICTVDNDSLREAKQDLSKFKWLWNSPKLQ